MHLVARHLPPGGQLPDARQLAAVLPGLLHADEDERRAVRPAHVPERLRRRLQRRRQGRHPRPQRERDPHPPLERLAARRRLQRRRAGAGIVAVHAGRPLLRRRLQRRRQGRGRRLQRHELGDGVPRPARRRRRRRPPADRPLRQLDAGLGLHAGRPLLRRRLQRRRQEGPVRLQRLELGDPVRRDAPLERDGLLAREALRREHAGWQMRPGDRHVVGDFTGDGKEDLWVFNGSDWSIPYLGMLRSTGTSLAMSKRYDGTMPGWQMRPQRPPLRRRLRR